jgi:hypothetical protein
VSPDRLKLCPPLGHDYLASVADKLSKQPENAPGRWYVDTSCALCRMYLEEAPNLITYNRDETAVHFLNNPKRRRKPPLRTGPWKCALRSQSEMTDENLRG